MNRFFALTIHGEERKFYLRVLPNLAIKMPVSKLFFAAITNSLNSLKMIGQVRYFLEFVRNLSTGNPLSFNKEIHNI